MEDSLHSHDHHKNSAHSHDHHHDESHSKKTLSLDTRAGEKILTLRLHSGIAGDMFLCGLMCMLNLSNEEANTLLNGILPELSGGVHREVKFVKGIRGSFCKVDLPHEHAHRSFEDVKKIIARASISEAGKAFALKAFSFVAEAEGAVHGKPAEEVTFHEVGALDSILDICLTSELFARLSVDRLIVSPLPIADGAICCAHGVIPSPAPAVQALLVGVPVKPFAAEGETVTPTGISLLKAFGAEFGPWPQMVIERIETVYGSYVYEGVPNGATFALGTGFE